MSIDSAANDGIKLNNSQVRILRLIRQDPSCTIEELSTYVGLKPRAIERNIKTLKDYGIIGREGSKKTGRWIVKDV